MSRLVHFALSIVALTLVSWSCSETTSEPTAGSVPLSIRVLFEDAPNGIVSSGDLGIQYIIESVTARAYSTHPQTGRVTLRDEQTDEIDPKDTTFSISLSVPPGNDYSLVVIAEGREEGSVNPGVLYRGEKDLGAVTVEEDNFAEVSVGFVIPILSIKSSGESYEVSWTSVTGPVSRYRLWERDTGSEKIRQYSTMRTDTTFSFPPTFAGQRYRQYRVVAHFEDSDLTAPSNQVDTAIPEPIPPAPITDLAVMGFGETEISLAWSATGDDGTDGTATSYDLRFSDAPITVGNFDDSGVLPSPPTPAAQGTRETYTATGLLTNTTYYFAVRAIDDAGATSGVSNVAAATTLPSSDDVTPPAPVVLDNADLTPSSVRLVWLAPGDDENEGTASRYELRQSLTEITESNFDDAELLAAPTPASAGTAQSVVVKNLLPETTYFFAIRTLDEAGNSSTLGTVLSLTTPAIGTAPEPIGDLAARTTPSYSVELTWTSPAPGSASITSYEVRSSRFAITPENFLDATLWDGPTPQSPGSAEDLELFELGEPSLYYFAIVSVDSEGERSSLSNVASSSTLDVTDPGGTTDLRLEVTSPTSVQLHWTAAGDDGTAGTATQYDLRSSTNLITPENFAEATPLLAPSPSSAGVVETAVVVGLTPEQPYYFALITEDEAENRSGLSNVVAHANGDNTPPAAVTNLAATANSGSSARITWTAPGDNGSDGTAESYDLRYNTVPITEFNFESSFIVPTDPPRPAGSAESYIQEGLVPDTYYFALRSADESGNRSATSNVASVDIVDTTIPNAIVDLTAGDVTANSMRLSWTAPGDDGIEGQATLYDLRISRSEITSLNFLDADVLSGVGAPDTSGTAQTFLVKGLTPSSAYYFAIQSEDDGGNRSAISNVVSITTEPEIPAAPSGLGAAVTSPSTIQLTWLDNSDNEENFDIEYRVAASSEFVWLTSVAGTDTPDGAYLASNLDGDTVYTFRVQATNSQGSSGFSNEASAQTGVPVPSNLSGIAISENQVDLSWSYPYPVPTTFVIERLNDTVWEFLSYVGGETFTYSDLSVAGLTLYTYRVHAVVDDRNSETSNTVEVQTPDRAPICSIDPGSLDFGTITIGTTLTDTITITNTGGDVLVGTAVFQDCDHFQVLSGGGPFGLTESQSRSIVIEFDPPSIGSHTCNLLTGSTCAAIPISGTAASAKGDFWWDGFDRHPDGEGMDEEVRSFATYGSKLLVGGAFRQAGALSVHGIASWSGTSWVSEETTGSFLGGGAVSTVSFFDDGKVSYPVAGGEFSGSAADPAHYSVRSGGIWEAMAESPNDEVLATYPTSSGIWVGGYFSGISGTSGRAYLAFDNLSTWDDVGDFNGAVHAITEHAGEIVVAGDFTSIDGSGRSYIAMHSGSGWSALGIGMNGPVYGLLSYQGDLYAVGDFTEAGTSPAKGVAYWDGYNWQSLDLGIDFGEVQTITEHAGSIVIGGSFTELNNSGDPLNRIATYVAGEWLPFGPGISNGEVLALQSFQGALYVGGSFTQAGTKASHRIARWAPIR